MQLFSFILGISIFMPLHLVFVLMFRILNYSLRSQQISSLCKSTLPKIAVKSSDVTLRVEKYLYSGTVENLEA